MCALPLRIRRASATSIGRVFAQTASDIEHSIRAYTVALRCHATNRREEKCLRLAKLQYPAHALCLRPCRRICIDVSSSRITARRIHDQPVVLKTLFLGETKLNIVDGGIAFHIATGIGVFKGRHAVGQWRAEVRPVEAI